MATWLPCTTDADCDSEPGSADGVCSATSECVTAPISLPVGVFVSPDDAHLYVTSNHPALSVFGREESTGRFSFIESYFPDPAGLGKLTISTDGAHLYLAGAYNTLYIYERNSTTGQLSLVEVMNEVIPGAPSGWIEPAVGPDNRRVYVSHSGAGAVAVFERDPLTGGLNLVELHQDERCSTGTIGDTCTTDSDCYL
jgi:6-phosphogluconolactonase (cycloisomerase 2 family)